MVSYIYDYLRSFYSVLLMASFIPFLVYFILSWGDHLRARLLFTLEGEPRYTLAKALDGVGDMVRAYVVGNFLLGVLLSVASAILFASVRLPYWPVVGPMSGFLSLVPYIGMPLALIPPLIAALPTRRTDAVPVSAGERRPAAPVCAEPAVSQICGIARAPESAGRHHRADAVGHAVGRHRTDPGHPHHRGPESDLR